MSTHTDAPATHPAPPLDAAAPPPPVVLDDDDVDRPPIDYDPAEYRWVPVRRRARLDGWTEEKQRRFIEVLADTGQVRLAAKAVGMTRESAYKLRRAAHAAAFARAWDAARHHAGSLLEDIAFARAIEGVEVDVHNREGDVIATKRVVNDRILTFLLAHLKPERYGRAAIAEAAAETVEASLRALEPRFPAPPEDMLHPDTLEIELQIADIADGSLPHFLREQRPEKTEAARRAEAHAALDARGAAATARCDAGEKLDKAAFADMCYHLDPVSNAELLRRALRENFV